jgi:hypothetical protein
MTDWRHLGAAGLSERIQKIQRMAVEQHLPRFVWDRADAMRRQLKSLQRTEAKLAFNTRRRPRAPISLATE